MCRNQTLTACFTDTQLQRIQLVTVTWLFHLPQLILCIELPQEHCKETVMEILEARALQGDSAGDTGGTFVQLKWINCSVCVEQGYNGFVSTINNAAQWPNQMLAVHNALELLCRILLVQERYCIN
ncbi:hypothetical protein CDAR_289191 [Caerostris darwini]|uniref:Uncharacterized protein n=1 Tax=Caerostris darwini TaxID=1538125 RepID=A0AAV4PJ68_9ARAC|nr:hypothetical protein CDAR_289191 [Caerostris darwini]